MKKDSLSKSKKKNHTDMDCPEYVDIFLPEPLSATDSSDDEFQEETDLFAVDMFLPEPMCPTDDNDAESNDATE